MTETRQLIIELGEKLIRTKGFHAFSYKDISGPLGIRNAAVHYHFPSKTDLGVAIIENSQENFLKLKKDVEGLREDEQIRLFLEKAYLVSHQKGWVCISGALSPVYETLPEQMQEKLSRLGEDILTWVSECLQKGKEKDVFHFSESPEIKSQLIISNLLSSLLLSKMLGKEVFGNIFSAVLKSL